MPGVDSGIPDAGDGGSVPPAPTCELVLPGALEASEGGRVLVTVRTEPPGGRIEPGTLAEGVRTAWRGDGLLDVKVPYGVSVVKVPLTATCADATGQAELSVAVRALQWAPTTTWTAGTDGPPDREYGSMWLDAVDPSQLYVFAGFHYQPRQFTPSNDAWRLDLGTGKWTSLGSPAGAPAMGGFRVAPIPGSHEVLVYGGIGTDGLVPDRLARLDLSASPPTWNDQPLSPQSGGRGDYQPAFFHDVKRSRYLAVCGADGVVGIHCGVNAFVPADAGGRWVPVPVATGEAPAPRVGFFWAYDDASDRLIVFGGDASASGGNQMLQDTWALELDESPPRWVKLAGPQSPAIGRRNGAYALDPVNHRLFTWGGTPNGSTTLPGLYVLDLERNFERWEKVMVPSPPHDRTSAQAVYDAAGRRIIAGFGNDDTLYDDLWSLKL